MSARKPQTYIKVWGFLLLSCWSSPVGTDGLQSPTPTLQRGFERFVPYRHQRRCLFGRPPWPRFIPYSLIVREQNDGRRIVMPRLTK